MGPNARVRLHVITVLMFGAVLTMSLPALGAGPVHNIDAGTDHDSIQEALDNSTSGDRIVIDNGTYLENIFINHSISISGNWSSGAIINGTGTAPCLTVNTSHVHLSNLTFINSTMGIHLADESGSMENITILNSTFSENLVGLGSRNVSNVSIHGCWFNDNKLSAISAIANSSIGNISAERNYWGADPGPYEFMRNPYGTGDSISGSVSFEPWLDSTGAVYTNQRPTAVIDNILVPPPAKDSNIYFSGHGTDDDGIIIAYRWISNLDGLISRLASFDLSNLSAGNHLITFSVTDDDGAISVVAYQTIKVVKPETQDPIYIDDGSDSGVDPNYVSPLYLVIAAGAFILAMVIYILRHPKAPRHKHQHKVQRMKEKKRK